MLSRQHQQHLQAPWVLYFPFFNICLVWELHTHQSVPKGQWVTAEIYPLDSSTALRWPCSYWRKQVFWIFIFFSKHDRFEKPCLKQFLQSLLDTSMHFKGRDGGKRIKTTKNGVCLFCFLPWTECHCVGRNTEHRIRVRFWNTPL